MNLAMETEGGRSAGTSSTRKRLFQSVPTFLFFPRDVFDRQQDHLRPAMRFDAPRVEDHVPQSKMLEIVAHFKTVEARVARRDLVKQFAKFGDIPLVVAEFVDEASPRLFGRDLKGSVKHGI